MTEHALHMAVAQYLRVQCPRLLWWTVDQTALHGRHGRTLKEKGVLPGVPDLSFVLPPNGRAAYIELKWDKGRQTPTQEAFETQARAAGALYAVCRSVDEVEGVLRGWGVLKERAA